MEQIGNVPSGRYEHKYLVTDQIAVAIRDAILPYVDVDAHTPPGSKRGYVVHSVYLDTPMLDLYRQTREGQSNRFKLRVRFYDDQPQGVAFVEIKEKAAGQVFKRRYAADKPFVQALLEDPQCEPLVRTLNNGGRGSALDEFCQRRRTLGAGPKVFITYQREAYNSNGDPPVRITFDRRIRTNACGRGGDLSVPPYGTNIGGLNVLVEFKYAGDPPAWLNEVQARFGLRRESFSKFAECVDALQIFGPQPQPLRPRKKKKKNKKLGNNP
jgi:hypothetical protein